MYMYSTVLGATILTDSGVQEFEAKVRATMVRFELHHHHTRYEERLSCEVVTCVLANVALIA